METEREHSVTYQCWRRGVPVFCPALTDGSMGDMIFFFNYSTPGLIVDPLGDERALVDTLASATHGVSVVLLGAGLPKHHALAAVRKAEAVAGTSLLHAVVSLTTGVPGVDGSVSGGCKTDDVSGGLLRPTTTSNASARVEATAAFPLLCARALTR
jgi:deoxyhypusine synthase